MRFAAAWLNDAERHKIALTVAAGALLGVAVTMTSVGAGALGVAVLVALYPLRLPSDRLVATDIAHALPITAIAAAGHAVLGHVNLRVLACLLVGSIPGVILRHARDHSPSAAAHADADRDHAGHRERAPIRLLSALPLV